MMFYACMKHIALPNIQYTIETVFPTAALGPPHTIYVKSIDQYTFFDPPKAGIYIFLDTALCSTRSFRLLII